MYIHYSTGNNSGPRTLVRIVEVSVIGGVHFRRFHCILEFFYTHANGSNHSVFQIDFCTLWLGLQH